MKLTQTFNAMIDWPSPPESTLLTPTNQISHHKQGHRLLVATSSTFCVYDSRSNYELILIQASRLQGLL